MKYLLKYGIELLNMRKNLKGNDAPFAIKCLF